MEPVHVRLRITGKVQGVRYRATAVAQALDLGLTGFAMNMLDGSVLIEAEGQRERIAEFIRWCHQGPPLARVAAVDVEEGDVRGFDTFATRH